jgi:polyhydroxyalkanoate synthase
MFQFPLSPDDIASEIVEMNRKVLAGLKALSQYREGDIQVGQTPRELVYQDERTLLWHFPPVREDVYPVPLVITYSLVNRPFLADLQPDRSLIRNLLSQGIDVYLVDYGYPSRNDRYLTLHDYINLYLDSCIDFVCARHGLDQINLMGICQGGTFALIHAAQFQHKLKNLVTMVAPVDFYSSGSLLNLWSGCAPGAQHQVDFDLVVRALGNIPGDFINWGFLMQKPFELTMRKYLDLLDVIDNEAILSNFLTMEKWIFDSPDQAGEAWREFITKFYVENQLVKGEFEIGGVRINLGAITLPVLNLYAEQDHIVPPNCSIALADHIGSRDYTVKSFPVGHIGMYVSRKTQETLAPTIAEWLVAHD